MIFMQSLNGLYACKQLQFGLHDFANARVSSAIYTVCACSNYPCILISRFAAPSNTIDKTLGAQYFLGGQSWQQEGESKRVH